MSTTVTTLPRSARQAAVVSPTYPAPMTATLLKPGRLSLDQHVPDLCQDAVWMAQHVRCGESKQSDTGREKPILAAIVLDETQAMELTVVFEGQLALTVVQVGASNENATLVMKLDLCLR